MNCTACGAELKTPLETYGDYNAPMCSDCHFAFLDDGDEYRPLYSYTSIGNGYYEKRLTEAGAIFLEGTPGELMMIVRRPV
jgi:hypothetical protein